MLPGGRPEEASQALEKNSESALAVKSAEAIVASTSTELETMQQLVREGLKQGFSFFLCVCAFFVFLGNFYPSFQAFFVFVSHYYL